MLKLYTHYQHKCLLYKRQQRLRTLYLPDMTMYKYKYTATGFLKAHILSDINADMKCESNEFHFNFISKIFHYLGR